jgi:hypothetical protein
MSALDGRPQTAGTTAELWSAIRFQEELRRVSGSRTPGPIEDPLAQAVKIIEQNPAYSQSRLLTRMLSALTYQQGEFRPAEIAAFDSRTRAIVIALMDACAAGLPVREEWIRAVDAATAALDHDH